MFPNQKTIHIWRGVMKKTIATMSLFTLCFSPMLSLGQDKVVVIPLHSSKAAGTDKQIQYNDGGNIAGAANVFYNKTTGFLGVNTTTPSSDIDIKQSDEDYTGTGGITFIESDDDNDTWRIYHSGIHFSFNNLGNRLAYVENGTGNWVQPSSRDAKNDITELNLVLEKTMRLNPVSYTYKHDVKHSQTYGFIAEDVELLFPELVSYDEHGNRGLSYAGFGPITIRAIQEQQQQIEELCQENEILKNKIAQIEQVLNL